MVYTKKDNNEGGNCVKLVKCSWIKCILCLLTILCVVYFFPSERSSHIQAIQLISHTKKLPIYCVDTKGERKVALTFDVAWGADDINQILATLDKYQVKATFFIVGDWARKYPDMVKKLADGGHDIANHSDKHPHMNSMDKEAIKKDIMSAHEELNKITHQVCYLFRAPYGEYNNTVIEAAQECQYYTIQWDVDSLDWKNYGLEALIHKVVKHKNLRPGSIILLHNDTRYTAAALDTIIKGILEQDYRIVPISQLIITGQPYTLDFEGRQQPIS